MALSNEVQFIVDLKKAWDNEEKLIMKWAMDLLVSLVVTLMITTPKKSYSAAASWNVSIAAPDFKAIEIASGKVNNHRGAAKASVKSIFIRRLQAVPAQVWEMISNPGTKIICVANGQEYTFELNNGSSKQGAHFFEQAIAQFNAGKASGIIALGDPYAFIENYAKKSERLARKKARARLKTQKQAYQSINSIADLGNLSLHGRKSLSIAVTGRIPGFKNRAEFITAMNAKGIAVNGKVKKNADLVIVGKVRGSTAKIEHAKKRGVQVVTYKSFQKKFKL